MLVVIVSSLPEPVSRRSAAGRQAPGGSEPPARLRCPAEGDRIHPIRTKESLIQ